MKLLLLNPNTSVALTSRLEASARQVLSAEAELVTCTAREGFPYISSRAEAQLAGAGVLSILAERAGSYDAAVIAAFGDPGLSAARELFDCPVTGMSESSMLAACSAGERFAFVTFSPLLAPWYTEQVTRCGLGSRFAGVFHPDDSFGDIATVAEDLASQLTELCVRVASCADVLILAGAPIAGLAPGIREDVPALLLDPLQAAVTGAEQQFSLFPQGANRGSFKRPPGKLSTGLPGDLADQIARCKL
ncbi:aspartate/glutamate racemase family protein [Granulosicoccus sp. 3-233]|uniref:aspartate/glutamate racemase family protein n=1 Tax=Granulosicoccus sp. 3-233 TaxID=3417969 RepID=UPI003D34FED5